MSGLPTFADPSTAVVYHAVPAASASGISQGFVAGGQSQPPPPQTMAMMVVQNNPHKQQDSSTGMPLPPGMEIVLGGKKFKIHYQSYEMTREKATEYVAKCTGIPYSRMSSPPEPEAISHLPSAAGGSRSEARGVFGGTTTPMPTAADRFQRVTLEEMAALTAGDRGTIRTSSPTATSVEKYQRQKSPDEVYTMMAPAASGLLPPAITRGSLLQQQHPRSKLPKQHQVVTTEGSTYLAQTYAPSPPSGAEQQDQQDLGYFWEDGVWKVWQANSSNDTAAGAVGDTTAAKILPSVPVQQNQYSQHPQSSFPPQHQMERPQYQYQYQYDYPQQQQQQQQQPSAVTTTSAVHKPTPFARPHSQPPQPQPQHYPPQPPQIRGPLARRAGAIPSVSVWDDVPPLPGLLSSHGATSRSSSMDPMLPRYML